MRQQNPPEFWVRTAHDVYLPVHEMAVRLGPSQCRALPFVHSLSGRDTTSYPYYTGKKSWIKASNTVDHPGLESFGKDATDNITPYIIKEARDLIIAVYTTKVDNFEESNLVKLRAYKFLNNRSTLLKLLPPTEDAFLLHLKWAGLATITDKNAQNQNYPSTQTLGGPRKMTACVHASNKVSLAPGSKEGNVLPLHQGMPKELFLFKERGSMLCGVSVPGTCNTVQSCALH